MKTGRCTLLSGGLLAAVIGLAIAAASAQAAEPAPFGHPCKAQNGVRFCPTETLAQRVRCTSP